MGEAKQASAVIVGQTKNHRSLLWVRLVIALLVIIVIISLLYLYQRHQNNEKQAQVAAKTVCTSTDSGALLKQAAANLGPTSYKQLEPIVQKIQGLKTYQQDPNCLYVTVVYYINISNVQQASTNLEKFSKVYNAKQGLSEDFGNQILSIQTLQQDINALKLSQAQVQKSFITFGNP